MYSEHKMGKKSINKTIVIRYVYRCNKGAVNERVQDYI